MTLSTRRARPEPAVRALLGAFCLLTAAAVVSLVGLADRTEETFAWTIAPPVTAAFLGSGYGAGFVLSVLAVRADDWRVVRVPYVTVLVFTWLTAVATFVHLDRMHVVTPGRGPVAEPAAWLWLAVYVVIPVGMAALLVRRSRASRAARAPGAPGVAPHDDAPLDDASPDDSSADASTDEAPLAPTPRWLTAALGVQGLVLGVVGAALFVAPSSAAVLWPWELTPLTARVVASWLLAFAVATVLAVRDGDLARLRIATVAYTVFGLLQLVTAARFAADVDWTTPRGLAWLATAVVVVTTGAVGWALRTPTGARSASGRGPRRPGGPRGRGSTGRRAAPPARADASSRASS